MDLGRRRFVGGIIGAGVVAAGLTRTTLADLVRAERTVADFGGLGPADALGVRVPSGFTSSLIGRTGDAVASSTYVWHAAPDGGACFTWPGGPDDRAHVYVSNSEVGNGGGGVGAVWCDGDGDVVDAGSMLTGTSRNCAGGATPWRTWLSCEEDGPTGQVWECDVDRRRAVVRPALGSFNHEAVAIDPIARCCYLTEDDPAGRLYRFVPSSWPDLSEGSLQAAGAVGGRVIWIDVPADRPARGAGTIAFDGGEGIVVDDRSLLFATKGDRRVWELDLETNRLSVFFDAVARPGEALTHVDNLAVHPWSGHLFVAEDGGNVELCMLTRTGGRPVVSAVVRFEGHDGSEVAGPAFSPDGRHLYVSSQRGTDGRGVTVRVTGPWAEWASTIGGGADAGTGARRLGMPD